MAVYLDASAIVKLVLPEMESAALRRFLDRDPAHTSSVIGRVEVLRATRLGGSPDRLAFARETLARFSFVALDDGLLESAANLEAPLRTLDAIHVVSAQTVGPGLRAFVTYDDRLRAAALELGLPALAPGRGA